MEEQLPIRAYQLLRLYGPDGDTPILPAPPADEDVLLAVGAARGPQGFVWVLSLSGTALDLSGWRLEGSASYSVPPGTVLPGRHVLLLAPDSSTASLLISDGGCSASGSSLPPPYVQISNPTAEVPSGPWQLKLIDGDGRVVAEAEGSE